ncbi:MAG: HAMP domain-containing histidine kinase [Acidothermus cellulolyticus]|nr:HAMP domain-containing histidine kinase [Acidothermus cellulolyticus]
MTAVTSRWRRISLRARLVMVAAAGMAVLLALTGVFVTMRLRSTLIAEVTKNAARQALAVAAAIDGLQHPHISGGIGEDAFIQIVDATGRVVAATGDIEGEPPLFTFRAEPNAGPVVRTVPATVLGSGAYRVATVTTTQPPRYTVYAGLPLDGVDHTVASFAGVLAVALPALLAALVLGTWVLAGRALRPVEQLRAEAAQITITDLHRRVTVPPARDELARLAATLNDFIARLDTAVRRQRQFFADAAHELRSPVAAIRAQIEAAAVQPATVAAIPPTLFPEITRLGTLVDGLLLLARLDSRPPMRVRQVDLDDVLRDEVQIVRTLSTRRIDTSAVAPVRIEGDEYLLRRAIRNLLENAVRYAQRSIVVSLGYLTADECRLTVADDGPGIPEGERSRIFERFTRLDEARDRDTGGAGLGLAIVAEIVHAHRGRVWVEDNAPGARFVVTLPVRPLTRTPGNPAPTGPLGAPR